MSQWDHAKKLLAIHVLSELLVASSAGLEIKRIPVLEVVGVVGGSTALPCHVQHPGDDAILLLLWFKDGLTTPIYRYDDRSGSSQRTSHWSASDALGTRASLEVLSVPAQLVIKGLHERDEGLYYCRVDFRKQPTKTTRVVLTVVVPPHSVSVYVGDENPESVTSVVGPFHEGAMVTLTCVAQGGKPTPSVVWFEDTHLLDSEMESDQEYLPDPSIEAMTNSTPLVLALTKAVLQVAPQSSEAPLYPEGVLPRRPSNTIRELFEGQPYNTLLLGPLQRRDLKLLLTCEAANNNLTLPTSVVVMIDMNLAAVSIELLTPTLPLEAGREYQVMCQVGGARPPPTITWWRGDRRVLQHAAEATSADGNITTSTLMFTPSPSDDNTTLRCVAESPATETTLYDSWELTVHYIPRATARFGASLDASKIKEDDDVYFECIIDANPRTSRVTWRHNNHALAHNISGGIIVSNQSLVLQRIGRYQAGTYTCHAYNRIGDGASNALRLDVKYAPVCARNQITRYAVSKHEDAEVTCTVDANPPMSTFQWTFNNTADTIDVPQGRFSTASTHSVITYTPMTPLDYGTLLCWATNTIGTQREPCLFHIVPAGKPAPPSNCTVARRMRTSLRIVCSAGDSGGSDQVFHLRASASAPGAPVLNITAQNPVFIVDDLSSGSQYSVEITAENERGLSVPTYLSIAGGVTSGAGVFPVGPSEAEVRDPGKTIGGVGNGAQGVINTSTSPESSDNRIHGSREDKSIAALIPTILGISLGLLLVIFILALLIFMRVRYRRGDSDQMNLQSEDNAGRLVGSTPHLASLGTGTSTADLTEKIESKIAHTGTCIERDIQMESDNDMDPDLIPLKQNICSVEWDSSGNLPFLTGAFGQTGHGSADPDAASSNSEGRASTLLPPDRYGYQCSTTVASMSTSNSGYYPRLSGSSSSHNIPAPQIIGSSQQQQQLQQAKQLYSQSHTRYPQQHHLIQQHDPQLHQMQNPHHHPDIKLQSVTSHHQHQQLQRQQSYDLNRLPQVGSGSRSIDPMSHILPSSTSSSPTAGSHCVQHPQSQKGVQQDLPHVSSTLPRQSSSQHLHHHMHKQHHNMSDVRHHFYQPQHQHQQVQQQQQQQQGYGPSRGQEYDRDDQGRRPSCQALQRGSSSPQRFSQPINTPENHGNKLLEGQRREEQSILDNIPEPPPPFRENRENCARCDGTGTLSDQSHVCQHDGTTNKKESSV